MRNSSISVTTNKNVSETNTDLKGRLGCRVKISLRNILINNLSDQEQWDYLRPRVEEEEDDDEQFCIDQATAGYNALVDLSDLEDGVDDDDDA